MCVSSAKERTQQQHNIKKATRKYFLSLWKWLKVIIFCFELRWAPLMRCEGIQLRTKFPWICLPSFKTGSARKYFDFDVCLEAFLPCSPILELISLFWTSPHRPPPLSQRNCGPIVAKIKRLLSVRWPLCLTSWHCADLSVVSLFHSASHPPTTPQLFSEVRDTADFVRW